MSTLLPFLYQTRTLQRAIRGPLPQLVRALHGTPARQHPRKPPSGRPGPGGGDDSVPFEFGPDQGPLAATRTKKGPSTITESEKRVFDEIFGSISQRQKQLGVPLVPDLEPEPPAFGQQREEGVDEQDLNRDRILSMYPPALRRAAEIALGLQAEEDGEDFADGHAGTSSTQVTPEDAEEARRIDELMSAERAALLALHREEKTRVQSLMQSCTTDVALWKVLEDHVFSMVDRLGISNRKPDLDPKRRGKKSSKNKPSPPALSMERHGPLYSVHLLSALRHLDRGFATPSPLALNVLPRILELGMASYVLGVSTRFYNEVMSIYWHRYGDVHSVMRLLKEMERAGLSGDGQTLRVVESVMGAIEGLSAEEGRRNAFADVLGSMQEFDSVVLGKLGRRKKWVLSSMHERADELPY